MQTQKGETNKQTKKSVSEPEKWDQTVTSDDNSKFSALQHGLFSHNAPESDPSKVTSDCLDISTFSLPSYTGSADPSFLKMLTFLGFQEPHLPGFPLLGQFLVGPFPSPTPSLESGAPQDSSLAPSLISLSMFFLHSHPVP